MFSENYAIYDHFLVQKNGGSSSYLLCAKDCTTKVGFSCLLLKDDSTL